jgi:hypothetical protein
VNGSRNLSAILPSAPCTTAPPLPVLGMPTDSTTGQQLPAPPSGAPSIQYPLTPSNSPPPADQSKAPANGQITPAMYQTQNPGPAQGQQPAPQQKPQGKDSTPWVFRRDW